MEMENEAVADPIILTPIGLDNIHTIAAELEYDLNNIVEPGGDVNAELTRRLSKFNKKIIKFAQIPKNNTRILGDLVHDINGLVISKVKSNNGRSERDVIDYLVTESGNSDANKINIRKEVETDFLTTTGNARPSAITKWLNDYLKENNLYLEASKQSDDIETFIRNLGDCKTILLDSQFENIVTNYFANQGFTYLFPTVCLTDGATKLASKTVDKVGITFKTHFADFAVHNFFDSRKHTFSTSNNKNASIRVTKPGVAGGAGAAVPPDVTILEASVEGGFSVNGIAHVALDNIARGKGVVQSDGINKPKIEEPISLNKKLELILLKTITDYSQVYYAAVLWHILGYKTVFITNDTFCLPLACLWELPFVILSKINDPPECYIFSKGVIDIVEDTKRRLDKLYDINLEEMQHDIIKAINDYISRYEEQFYTTGIIKELLASDIAIKDLNDIKSSVNDKFSQLKKIQAADKSDDNYKSLLAMGFSTDKDLKTSINTIMLGDNQKVLKQVEKKYTKINSQIKSQIEVLRNEISTNYNKIGINISKFYNYFRGLLFETKNLSELFEKKNLSELSSDNLIELFIALTFYETPSAVSTLLQYYFSDKNKIPIFRRIARYMYVIGATNYILDKILQSSAQISIYKAFIESDSGRYGSLNNNSIEQFPRLYTEFNKEYYTKGKVTSRHPDDYHTVIINNKHILELYSQYYQPNSVANVFTINGILINDKTHIDELKRLRASEFTRIKDSPLEISQAPFIIPKDYLNVAYLDHNISIKEKVKDKDLLEKTIRYLNIFVCSIPSHNMLGTKCVPANIPMDLAYFKKSDTGYAQVPLSSGPPSKRRKRGGAYPIDIIKDIKAYYEKDDYKNGKKLDYYYKPSVSSTIISKRLPHLKLAINLFDLFKSFYYILELFSNDAIETNELDIYQESLNNYYIANILPFYSETPPNNMFDFLINKDDILHSYIFNLLDKPQIIDILEIFIDRIEKEPVAAAPVAAVPTKSRLLRLRTNGVAATKKVAAALAAAKRADAAKKADAALAAAKRAAAATATTPSPLLHLAAPYGTAWPATGTPYGTAPPARGVAWPAAPGTPYDIAAMKKAAAPGTPYGFALPAALPARGVAAATMKKKAAPAPAHSPLAGKKRSRENNSSRPTPGASGTITPNGRQAHTPVNHRKLAKRLEQTIRTKYLERLHYLQYLKATGKLNPVLQKELKALLKKYPTNGAMQLEYNNSNITKQSVSKPKQSALGRMFGGRRFKRTHKKSHKGYKKYYKKTHKKNLKRKTRKA
jgi:hypothetical protein